MLQPVIIIGAGLAGWTTAREFRKCPRSINFVEFLRDSIERMRQKLTTLLLRGDKLDTSTPVMLITADTGDFYGKPSLSNALAQDRTPAQLVTILAAAMAEKLNVTLLPHTLVETVDPVTHTVTTGSGAFGYSKLVLTTGARPIRVAVEGDAGDQILSVNSLDDFEVFHRRLMQDGRGSRVFIMGAGLIGCEFANDLAIAGYRVGVADPADRPLAALLPQPASEQLRDALTGMNVSWHFGATVKAVEHNPESADCRLRISLSTGVQVHADQVLSAIGLKADITLAQNAGLACERGIVVDSLLQTSAANIYALGDCAQYAIGRWNDANARSVSGGRTLPFVMPVMNAAKALAATLSGKPTELAFPLMPIAVKTPALPIVLAPPPFRLEGRWNESESGIWLFVSTQGHARGFVLTGKKTAKRAELSSLPSIADQSA
jgi:rubredoxin-NAD+ reductase